MSALDWRLSNVAQFSPREKPHDPDTPTLCDDHRGSHAQGYWRAMEDVMHHINQLDSGGMTGREVRSAIYGFCLDARPALSQSPAIDPRVEELVEAAKEALGTLIYIFETSDDEHYSRKAKEPVYKLDTALAPFGGKAE